MKFSFSVRKISSFESFLSRLTRIFFLTIGAAGRIVLSDNEQTINEVTSGGDVGGGGGGGGSGGCGGGERQMKW